MSMNWYPIIDYEKCINCGACVAKCKNGVYSKKSKSPKIIYPNGCKTGCRGCQKLCPMGAITYNGDTGKEKCSDCSCSCS